MLQFAGLAAILNEINPGLGDKISEKFNGTVSTHLTEPIAKSYKYGWTNGLMTGLLGGILLTVATYKICRKLQESKTQTNSIT